MKQVFRAISRPETLMGGLMRAKYFRDKKWWNMKAKDNHSWLWKCWLKSAKWLRRGLRVRIGNGKDTLIWEAPWIPTNPHVGLSREYADKGGLTWVSQLILEDRVVWNRALISNTFDRVDAEEILSIPLRNLNHPDTVIWHFDEKGHFSVKSANTLISNLTDNQSTLTVAESSSRGAVEKKRWKRIRVLAVHNKFKYFLWRVIR
ncbi:Unknown protein [Striga hermonthica]|uniref:Reverse transcriptase zinc-binding domain-containing protein n=1 Tax=Striga hermonthica TaxID=68872 RepID=A0A9N7MYV9_STRHE|nr:Unknown protein [Striga hermonthica]